MIFRLAIVGFLVLMTGHLAPAQLPPSQTLSETDNRAFNKELQRLRNLLLTANDKGAIRLQIANTYAAGGQYSEAIRRLGKVVDANLGFDPSRDPDFVSLRKTREFQSIIEEVRRQTPPVSNSWLVATIHEPDLLPENIAFDPTRKTFFLGNTEQDQIVRCAVGGACVPLIRPHDGEPGYILGLKIDRRYATVWATSNAPTAASLRQYNIESGKLIRSAQIEGKHVFNDVAVSPEGVVYVTDTSEGSVYELDKQTSALRKIAPQHRFTAANGIAISPDGKTLYVSAWGDGIDAIDLRSGSVTPIRPPETIGLTFIDGLYADKDNLIAIQNGPMLPRIVQFKLDEHGLEIIGMTILERRNPFFDGITTGALVDGRLYYVANPQTDKKKGAKLNPLRIMAVRVRS